MRKGLRVLALFCVGCLVLSGCQTGTGTETAGETKETIGLFVTETVDETFLITETFANWMHRDESKEKPEGEPLKFGKTGKLRVEYRGDGSGVQYVTAADQLPDYEAFEGYGEEFFQHHGLVLVRVTFGSGSIRADIDSITVEESAAVVTLDTQMPGEGTADMATWLLWAEVAPGLEYEWSLANSGAYVGEKPKGEIS